MPQTSPRKNLIRYGRTKAQSLSRKAVIRGQSMLAADVEWREICSARSGAVSLRPAAARTNGARALDLANAFRLAELLRLIPRGAGHCRAPRHPRKFNRLPRATPAYFAR